MKTLLKVLLWLIGLVGLGALIKFIYEELRDAPV